MYILGSRNRDACMHEANEELGRYEPNWRLFGERQPATWFSSFQVVLEDDGMLAETTGFLSERTGARNNEATNCFDPNFVPSRRE